mgnify:CR=1 FL=1
MILKRILSSALALTLVLSLAACGKEESSDEKTTTTTQATELTDNVTTPETNTDNLVYIEGTKFMVDGKEIWFNGVNTPWDNWNDFGGNFDYTFWDTHFAELRAAGVNATRIWINCNGLVGVILNEDGSFKEVTQQHWSDLDSLMELAQKHGIYIMATLMSFDHYKDSNTGYKNWRNMTQNEEYIKQFVDGYVIPLCQRYDNNNYLFSIDLMNEPDWVYENNECGKLKWEDICNLFAHEAAAIHENSDILVTVGFGIIKYNSDKYEGNMGSDEYLSSLSGNDNSYLDYYSTHYYHWEKPWFGYPFDKSPADFKLDGTKPSVIGECAAVDESGVTLKQRYEDCYNNGWNGAFAWTSNGVDACGGYTDVAPATKNILEIAGEEKIYPYVD